MKNDLKIAVATAPQLNARRTHGAGRRTLWPRLCALLVFSLACALAAQAQVTTGNVRGIVTDPQGAVVPNAKVTLTEKATNNTQTAQTTGAGEYEFKNLLPADDYSIVIEAPGFKTLTLSNVRVQLNQTTDVPAQLTIGQVGETVEVTAGGAELVDTTTQNLAKTFTSRQVVELAQTSTGLGVYNLALIAPNVSSSGGVGVGSGGSVGGQRPRNNNFVVDGIDNNDKSVTGPQVYISPETIGEFSLLQNQYSAEFARSTGGQFIVATKSGTNEFHGTAYFFGRNRHLNAIDTLNKQPGNVFVRDPNQVNEGAGIFRQPRSDYFRTGGNAGGPIIKDKLFFFGSFERIGRGDAAGTSFFAPTAAGYAQLATIPNVKLPILNLVKQFVPAASTALATVSVGGQNVPVGSISVASPNFFIQKNWVANIDWTQSPKTQHRFRFIKNDASLIDSAGSVAGGPIFPQFFQLLPINQYLFSYTNIHTFTSSLTNETRLAFRRHDAPVPVPNVAFPLAGFNSFPNITVDELGFNIGPDQNAPQFTIENNYQVIDNLTWLKGNHSIKFGGDFRKLISPQRFVQRERGDYDYANLETLLFDKAPDVLGERNVGGNTYYGDQRLFFAFFQDDWRLRPNLTFNLGLNYAYQEIPFGAKQQELNAISTVPGVLEFRRPRAQKKNFAPRVGFAYSPDYDQSTFLGRLFGAQGKTSIRAGFSMAYDVIFDNIYVLSSPPQFQQTIDVQGNETNFLTNGGIPNVVGATLDPASARSVTATYIPDQQVPYSTTWTGSIQRQFLKDWSLELRYLGTRGVHLLTQNRINRQNRITDTDFVPTFVSAPSASVLAGLDSLQAIRARHPAFLPQYVAAGFSVPTAANGGAPPNIVAFLPNGNSTYHGASATLTHRFTRGYQMTAAYTWSHLIDDTTAEVFSTVLSPRRVEDFQNLSRERADSALDRRHRFVLSSLYTLPYFTKSENRWVRTLLGGFNFAGTLTFESGEKATVRSGVDSNLNGDAAGDRAIINLSGARNVFSPVCAIGRNGQCILVDANGELTTNPALGTITSNPVTASARSATVGYLALNPNAQYIQAGAGARSNSARNTLQLPGIRNLDFSVFKNFHITEGKYFQLRADLFNAFNHPQWTPGSVNGVELTSITAGPAAAINDIQANFDTLNPADQGLFNRPDLVYSSHPRIIQIAVRFNF